MLPTLQGTERWVKLLLLEKVVLICIFWNSSIKKICLLSPIYIFNHLFILICTRVYLFIAQIVSNLALWALSAWLLCHSSCPTFLFPYFLTLYWCSYSSKFFPTLVLQLAISPKSPYSFYWRILFRNQDQNVECVPSTTFEYICLRFN